KHNIYFLQSFYHPIFIYIVLNYFLFLHFQVYKLNQLTCQNLYHNFHCLLHFSYSFLKEFSLEMIYYYFFLFYFFYFFFYIFIFFFFFFRFLLYILLIHIVLLLLFFLSFYFQSIRSMLFDLTSIHPLITVYIVAIESLVSSVPKS